MTQPDSTEDDAPALEQGTDITAEDAPAPAPEDTPATSDAELYRDQGDTQGGTGGLDSGGAG